MSGNKELDLFERFKKFQERNRTTFFIEDNFLFYGALFELFSEENLFELFAESYYFFGHDYYKKCLVESIKAKGWNYHAKWNFNKSGEFILYSAPELFKIYEVDSPKINACKIYRFDSGFFAKIK